MIKNINVKEFGFLTLATKNDYLKAIGLYYSLKKLHPKVLVAIACTSDVRDKVESIFDIVIDQDTTLKGFEHKVNLDKYTPFNKTFFFDADVLIFKELSLIIDSWAGSAYAARGSYVKHFISAFGLNSDVVLDKCKKDALVNIGAAGHAYFEKPACGEVFDLARVITTNYEKYANTCVYADEDVMGIAMTLLDIAPKEHYGFHARLKHAVPGSIDFNMLTPSISFVDRSNGERVNPYMIHFAVKEAPFMYRKLLSALYYKYDVPYKLKLWMLAVRDFYTINKWKFKSFIKKLISA